MFPTPAGPPAINGAWMNSRTQVVCSERMLLHPQHLQQSDSAPHPIRLREFREFARPEGL
ncbi:hypothetical protein H6CHR_05098 [Variovorax sp. PBL-H6]|nr:hypothetical protein H6CHR_05098 [Variovorax sp. PBL-H6]